MLSKTTGNCSEVLISEKSITVENADQIRFSDYIKEKRKLEKSPSGKKTLSTRELADRLNIDYEQFRKILNMNKPTKKRDCIIAICAALRLNSDETNEALTLYQYMPVLDTKNPRDDLLIEILEEQLSNPLTIAEINQRLIRNRYPELDIIDHRLSTKSVENKQYMPYKLLKKHVRTFADDLIFRDQYDSFDTQYNPRLYRCIAEMWLDDTKGKKVYHLTTSSNNNYYMEVYGEKAHTSKSFKKIEDSEGFKDYFLELEAMVNRELKKMYSILNDTKNYQTRISAGIRGDAFHVYVETYNYKVPELNEYYLFEYQNGMPVLSVYRNSEFMHCYLDSDEYASIYGKYSNILIAQYASLDEIETRMETGVSKYLLKCRSRYFKRLKELADNLISDIKSKRQHIRYLDFIFDDRDRVCQFFRVEKEFQCTLDGEYEDIMLAGTDAVDFRFEDCGEVHITLEDLYKAFELGFNNINEICRVKKKYGSIEEIIK